MRRDEDGPDRIAILMEGLETVARADDGIAMSCLRTFLEVCAAGEREGRGIPVLKLAAALGTARTNVTRHLQFLRGRGFVGTVKDSVDARIDLTLPTEAGWELYDRLRRGRVVPTDP